MSESSKRAKIAIVSGASAGVGVEFLKQIDQRYPEIEELWMLARRGDRMEVLAGELSKRSQIFVADLTDDAQMADFWQALETQQPDIRILVNSAGFGTSGSFDAVHEDKALGMIDLNVRALVQMTKRCLPYMTRGSRILNLASVAAFLPQPDFAIYAASKSFVLSFSRALNAEQKKNGIHVIGICPNPMNTEFFAIAGDKPAKKSLKDIGIERVDKMVRTALRKSEHGRDLSTSCWQAKAIHVVSRLLPHRFILWAEKKMGMYK